MGEPARGDAPSAFRFRRGPIGVTLLAFALLVVTGATAKAAPISVFFDDGFVDIAGEGANLVGDLHRLDYTTRTFSGIEPQDFTRGIGASLVLVFPEMEKLELARSLPPSSVDVLRGFVAAGGRIVQTNAFTNFPLWTNTSLPNWVFGYALAENGNVGPTSLDVSAAQGTGFATGPLTLPGSNAVQGLAVSSLPASARVLYADGRDASVFAAVYGEGSYIYLGYDWHEEPTPDAWLAVLDRAVVPLPPAAALLPVGLAALALMRRRARTGRQG